MQCNQVNGRDDHFKRLKCGINPLLDWTVLKLFFFFNISFVKWLKKDKIETSQQFLKIISVAAALETSLQIP